VIDLRRGFERVGLLGIALFEGVMSLAILSAVSKGGTDAPSVVLAFILVMVLVPAIVFGLWRGLLWILSGFVNSN
jgi:hypothetical protein